VRGPYRIGLPRAGRWKELINTDAEQYGGSGVGNMGRVEAEPIPWHGQPFSAEVTLPPLAALWLVPDD
jgi:1,4-alpha-glucan branching enzyme